MRIRNLSIFLWVGAGCFIFSAPWTQACPRVDSITVVPDVFCIDDSAEVTITAAPEDDDDWPWDANKTWVYQITKEGQVVAEISTNNPLTGGFTTILGSSLGTGEYTIRAKAMGIKDGHTAWRTEWSAESETFYVLKMDLDGQEMQAPPPPQNWKDVPDDQEVNPGVLLVNAKTRLLVQDPGANVGKYKLSWTDPAQNKHLKLVGPGGPSSPIEVDGAGPWPKEYMAVAAGNWDYSDSVEVTLTHSLVACSDVVKLIVLNVEIKDITPDPFTPCSLVHERMTITYDAIDPSGTHTAKLKIYRAQDSVNPIHEVTIPLGQNQIYQWDGNPNYAGYPVWIDPYEDDYVEEELSPLLVEIGLYASPPVAKDQKIVSIKTFSKFVKDNAATLCNVEVDCADWAVYLWKKYCAQNSEAKDIGGNLVIFYKNRNYPDKNGNGLPDKPAFMVADMWHYSWSAATLPGALENVPDRDKDGTPALGAQGAIDYADLRPGDVIFYDYRDNAGNRNPDGQADHTMVIIEVRQNDAKVGYGTYSTVELDGLPGKTWPDEYDYPLPTIYNSLVDYMRDYPLAATDIHSIKRFRGEQ